MKQKVLVVGAGLGGLTAALGLLRTGVDVDVYEQAPELKEVGAGVQISANGTGALFALGLEAGVRKWGVHAIDKEIRLWNSGRTWSLFNSLRPSSGGERYSYPMFMLHRGDLHALLVDAVRQLKADAIHLNKRCVSFVQESGRVVISFQGGGSAEGTTLVGADGMHSVVRKQLFGAATPSFTGQLAWRALVPIERLPEDQRRLVGTNWVGPFAHVTCYPVHRGEFFNFVGQVDRTDWEGESWITEGSKQECLADFAGWHPHVQTMIEQAPALFKWGLFLREPLPRWTEQRVTLLGDACHAMLPYLGQGANMAIEDGDLLARCLERWQDDPEHALQRYEAARRDRTTEVMRRSAEMTGKFHNEALGNEQGAERYVNQEWHPDKIRERYDWIYQYDVTKVLL